MARSPRSSNGKPSRRVDALKHAEATRRNIPTAEMESFFRRDEDAAPRPPKHYPRARPLTEGETRMAAEPISMASRPSSAPSSTSTTSTGRTA
jgi:adenine-specific DNA-methyltransferase